MNTNAYSMAGAAKVLGLSRQRVYQLVHQGDLFAYQLRFADGEASVYLIPEKALKLYQAQRQAA